MDLAELQFGPMKAYSITQYYPPIVNQQTDYLLQIQVVPSGNMAMENAPSMEEFPLVENLVDDG